MEETVTRLLLDHAQSVPAQRPFPANLSLREDLAIESLSLVAIALRLGEELGVDMLESGIDLGRLDTVGDLILIARGLARPPDSHLDERRG